MNFNTTGFIFASGEGSRLKELVQSLGLPKHLFPIGNTTIAGRLATQLSNTCQEIVCVTQEAQVQQCQESFKSLPFPVKVIAKSKKGFRGDFEALTTATHEHIVLTMGDLIFPDSEVDLFVQKSQINREQAILAFDADRIKVPRFPTVVDFRIVMTAIPKNLLSELIPLNPESFFSIGFAFVRNYFKNRVSMALVKTLYNVNTPESYEEAKAFFN
ncbi:MAG: NTP transferase domain-containing protein [Pseudomonadota bacterium]